MACVFCEISAGRVGAHVLHRGAGVLAILDAHPAARGHCLVIPEAHVERARDAPGNLGGALFSAAGRAAGRIRDRMGSDALIAVHDGRMAGQEVAHLHVHVIPRAEGDGAGPVHSMFRGCELDGAEELRDLLSWD